VQVQGLTGIPGGTDTYRCDTVVKGNVQVQNNGSGSPIDIGDLGACQGVNGLRIRGNLQVQNNAGTVSSGGNTANGNIQVGNNSGGGTLAGNGASGDCQLQNDKPPLSASNNSAGPGHQDSCNAPG